MKKEDLLNLINDDDLGLLTIKPQNVSAITADERLVASFLEINNFIQGNKREPQLGGGVQEHQLASRLKSIREEKNKAKILLDFDEYNLLSVERKGIKSIIDIFEDDDLGVLDGTDENLFHLNNVPKLKERESADYIARRKPCKDFDKYEPLFVECQKNLKEGRLKLEKLKKHRQLQEGSFFVLGGILGLIEETYKLEINEQKKLNGRLRIVFENGTESNMLLQSLIKSLQDYNGWIISENSPTLEYILNAKDSHTGYIYILKSFSGDPKIQSLSNLFKIGFSSTPVEDRIKNVMEDPTFLMAPVKIVTTFECYNFNPQKLEQLLHNFFGSTCLNIDIFDSNNKRYTPREWFIAPLDVIEKTIMLIINGGIVNYKYDSLNQKIVLR